MAPTTAGTHSGTPAAIYVRISKDPERSGYGVARQQQDCEREAQRRGLEVVAVHADPDISAFSGQRRRGYEALLRDIKSGTVKAVIFWNTDRMERDTRRTLDLMDLLKAHGVDGYNVTGEWDISTADGRANIRAAANYAQRDSERSSERIKREKQQARAEGRWLGGPVPFGFRQEGHNHDARLVEFPEEADAIRQAVTDYLANRVSLHGIARRWNAQGFTTTIKHRPWYKRAVMLLLRSQRMALLVDDETREALIAKVTDPARRQNPNMSNSLRYMGSGFYRCGECGGPMAFHGGNSYACMAHRPFLTRTGAPIDREVELAACDWLAKMNIKLLPATDESGPLRKQLVELTAHANGIAGLLGERRMTVEQFAEANAPVQAEIKAIQAQLGQIEADSVLSGIADDPDPCGKFLAADVHRKRAVLDKIMTVTLLRQQRGGDPAKRGKGARFRPESVQIVYTDGTVYNGPK